MSTHYAVWIDHKEARVFHLRADVVDWSTVVAPSHHIHHKHPKGPEGVRTHPEDAKRFFHDVARTLEGTAAVLVVGPSTAKLELLRHLHAHDAALEARIVGVETVDHPSDGQLVAYAKAYFRDPQHRS